LITCASKAFQELEDDNTELESKHQDDMEEILILKSKHQGDMEEIKKVQPWTRRA